MLIPAVLAGFSLLTAGYLSTISVIRIVDGASSSHVRTRQSTVRQVLNETSILLRPGDLVSPTLDSAISNEGTITLQRARLVRVTVDNRQSQLVRTQGATAQDVLAALGFQVGPDDVVMIDGQFPATALYPLPEPSSPDTPITVEYHPAKQIVVQDEVNAPVTLRTTASTVGEALMQAGYIVYLADHVTPALGDDAQPGMLISIDRSKPVSVVVDGRRLKTRTHGATVYDVLVDLKVVLYGQDYTVPALDTPISANSEIRVVRVRQDIVINQDIIPYETYWQPDPDLELDSEALGQDGSPGVREHRTLITYEDGTATRQEEVANFVAREPVAKIYNYGTKIVLRELQTPQGTIQYWRVMRMLATSYTASTAGVSLNKPYYGRTRCGTAMRGGIVAVDPNVIPLRSNVYVEGYGAGYACDTGNAIIGNRIDLGFDEGKLELWYRWTRVYLMPPVPAGVRYRLD